MFDSLTYRLGNLKLIHIRGCESYVDSHIGPGIQTLSLTFCDLRFYVSNFIIIQLVAAYLNGSQGPLNMMYILFQGQP